MMNVTVDSNLMNAVEPMYLLVVVIRCRRLNFRCIILGFRPNLTYLIRIYCRLEYIHKKITLSSKSELGIKM